jgi:hypothetical protein
MGKSIVLYLMQDPDSDFDSFETHWFITDTDTGERLCHETSDLAEIKSTLVNLRANSDSKTIRAVRIERYTAEFYLNI